MKRVVHVQYYMLVASRPNCLQWYLRVVLCVGGWLLTRAGWLRCSPVSIGLTRSLQDGAQSVPPVTDVYGNTGVLLAPRQLYAAVSKATQRWACDN